MELTVIAGSVSGEPALGSASASASVSGASQPASQQSEFSGSQFNSAKLSPIELN